MKKFITGFIIFLLFYLVTYCVFIKVNEANADEPTITVPYTEEQMCKAFLRTELCDMSQEDQEKYFLEMFKALLDQNFKEENEVEGMEICLKETEQGKLIPCEGLDI